ncbi:MAG: hypothetical protein ACREQA_17355 [Candidatus Binatia bacterium]
MAAINNEIENIRNRCQDYESTVHALIAFSALIVHDGRQIREGAHFGIGRKMLTSSENVILPSSSVTPDVTAQRGKGYGIVGDVKRSLSKEQDQWGEHLEQLRKYDDRLRGWWTSTEFIEAANTAFIVHQTRSRAFVRYLEKQKNVNSNLVGPNSVVIEFNQSTEANVYMFFRLEWGTLVDLGLSASLGNGVAVPLETVLESFSSVRFYDTPPPLPLTLLYLWTDLFPAMADPSNYDEQLRAIPLIASVDEITKELRRAYGSGALERDSRSAEFPRMNWIRDALETLVAAKLAVPKNGDSYTVLYRPFREDVLTRFIEIVAKAKGKEKIESAQTTLLLDSEEQKED